MQLKISVATAALLSACATGTPVSAPAQAPLPSETLSFSPVSADSLETVRIDLTLPADTDGETVFLFPEAWGPDEDLGQLVSNRAVFDPATGDALPAQMDGNRVTVRAAPEQMIQLSYDIHQDYQGLPQWGVQRMPGMRPVLQPAYASLIGHTILPSVEGRDPALQVTFTGFPLGAAFSQPAPDGISAPIPLSTAQDSLYAFGAYRFGETDTGVRTAILGDWRLPDADIAFTTSSVLSLAGEAFEDAAFDQYFLAVTPLPDLPEGSSVIGTGLTESFLLLATRNADPENLTHTITHEILHEWITRRMGQTDEATDPARMWFTEGFTEYYTQLTLLGAGETSLEDFLQNMNALWAEYEVSSVNTMPAGDLIAHIWDSRETERLPYQRGTLLAFHWDTLARAEGRSLDEAVAALLDRAEAARARGETLLLPDAAIHAALETVIGPRFEADLATYVQGGAKLPLTALTLPSCLSVDSPPDAPARLILTPGADRAACRAAIAGPFARQAR
ncbi:hypothetical protein [Hyphomonas beringensis]|uniref:M61 family metallopeptidase n=1 Tax=Hyphomonas beringensis TaxID=1280946 RepID=UPI0009E0B3D5|nr:hypothetical protein [Hyphomonas beringensis]